MGNEEGNTDIEAYPPDAGTFTVTFTRAELDLIESVMTEYTQSNEGHSSFITEAIVFTARAKLAASRRNPGTGS